ncbi:MAG: FeoB-associated Cys-rich membrane protein [Clostridia bacterium]|nr:FeoB-associated Cys-rich membrane protein [Clostridia bacterium]
MGWLLILAVLAVLIVGIVVSLVRKKKNGASLCGGNCSCCPGCAAHQTNNKPNK